MTFTSERSELALRGQHESRGLYRGREETAAFTAAATRAAAREATCSSRCSSRPPSSARSSACSCSSPSRRTGRSPSSPTSRTCSSGCASRPTRSATICWPPGPVRRALRGPLSRCSLRRSFRRASGPARIRSCRTTPTVSASRTCPTRDRRRRCAPGWQVPRRRWRSMRTRPGVPPADRAASRAAIGRSSSRPTRTTCSRSATWAPERVAIRALVARVLCRQPRRRHRPSCVLPRSSGQAAHAVRRRSERHAARRSRRRSAFQVLCRSGGSRCSPAASRRRELRVRAGTPPIPLLDELGGSGPALVAPARLTDGPVCGVGAASLRRRPAARAPDRCHHTAGDGGRGAQRLRSRVLDARHVPSEGTSDVPDLQVTFEVAPRNMTGR